MNGQLKMNASISSRLLFPLLAFSIIWYGQDMARYHLAKSNLLQVGAKLAAEEQRLIKCHRTSQTYRMITNYQRHLHGKDLR